MFVRLAFGIVAVWAAGPMGFQAEAVEPIRGLYITGGGWHNYATQEEILTEGLSERVKIDWTIENEAGGQDDFWYGRFDEEGWSRGFDVVVYNFCITDIPEVDRVEGVVEEHVTSGTPAVWIHCAIHSFRADTTRWFEFGGMRSHRHESHHPYRVEALKPEHPIMSGFPEDGWQTPRGELYVIAEVYETATPLAHAYGEDTDQHHPNIWINDYKGVRVFATTIGHHNETMAEPVYLDLVARGLLWSVGKLKEDGTPAEGYGGVETATIDGKQWYVLFDGDDLSDWRPTEENPDSFRVEGDKIVIDGPRSHLFYDGPVADADFKDFHLRAEVLTYPNANSGIYFHTQWQPSGWPEVGYEAQVNATHSDRIKTGSLYNVSNVLDKAPHNDKEWFLYEIIVNGDRIVLKVDGKKLVDYTAQEDNGREQPRLSSGTFALQAHDPDSRIHYRNIHVRPIEGETFQND